MEDSGRLTDEQEGAHCNVRVVVCVERGKARCNKRDEISVIVYTR
jgi:hypothetical protein